LVELCYSVFTYVDDLHKFLNVGFKFPFTFVQFIRAGGYSTPWADGGLGDIPRISLSGPGRENEVAQSSPTRDGEEIGWDGNFLVKTIYRVAGLARHGFGASDRQTAGNDGKWRRYVEIKG
jgi:hypothetical protein